METATLQLPKDLIEAAIEKEISLAMAKALGDHSKILEMAVKRVLMQKVDSEGKPSRYSSNNDLEFIQWAVNDALTNAIRIAIAEEIKKYSELIRKNIAEQLARKQSPLLKSLVEGMTTGIVGSLSSKWNITVKYDGNR